MYWTENLATGIKTIDEQHKDIINKMNEVFKSKNTSNNPKEVFETLKYLENYVKRHFADEEKIQLQSKYPKYQQHKQAHAEFIKSVDKLFEKFNKEGVVLTLIIDVNKTILDLFIKHITNVDKQFADYYKGLKK